MFPTSVSLASLGDCVVDIYPQQNQVFLGGTAFNVAYHARKAGAQASIVSAVGNDKYGELFYQAAQESGINRDQLARLPGETSSVKVPLDEEGKPMFSGWELGVLAGLTLTQEQTLFLQNHRIARAILLKPMRGFFNTFAQMNLPNTFKVGDFVGGSIYSEDIEAITHHIGGLDMIVRSVDASDDVGLTTLKQIASTHDKLVLASLGAQGSRVFTKDQEFYQPVIKTDVADTTGAGDTYLAYFLVRYFETKNIQKAMDEATKAAAETITHLGANFSYPIDE